MLTAVLLSLLIQTPIWVEHVGTYTVEKYRSEKVEENWDEESIVLRDRHGREVTRIRNYRVSWLGVYDPRPERVKDLNADGIPEVIFEAWTGGAHGSNFFYIWSLGPKPVCRLAYDKGNIWGEDDRDFQIVDLDSDGFYEIRTWYDGFAYTYANAYTAPLPMILKLRNGRYVDATQAFPAFLKDAEKVAWQDLKEALPGGNAVENAVSHGPSVVELAALGDLAGRRRSALSKLRKELSTADYKWIQGEMPFIRKVVAARHDRLRYPTAYSGVVEGYGLFPQGLERPDR